ncbi:rab11 family-interacting protein 5 [Protopterus annectens]|uniref:rab11 family-interacting protein 5 n=1 Tax=Protopterus annectens TaxID=7888 RepID=UPI001CFB7064|nr:rab11 family-interacting protein 5 [Protopterus annectens]
MSLLGVEELLPEHKWVPTNVQVTVMRARGLRAKGKGGTSDAYTIIQLARDKFSTSVAEKTTGCPEWKEECSFELSPSALEFDGEGGNLILTVMHRALIGLDKFLGQIIIHLGHVFQDKRSHSSEWYKLHSKPGKKEKERGEIQIMIQFTRNNLTASMFDLSMKDKPRSTFGKLKDKMKGKKKHDMESASAVIPSNIGKLDSDEDDEKDDKKSRSKGFFLKAKLHKSSLSKSNTSLTSDKTVASVGDVTSIQVGLSDVLAEDAVRSGNTSDLANDIPVSDDQSPVKGKAHKRAFSDDAGSAGKLAELNESQNLRSKNSPISKSSLCVNGSHVYSEDKKKTPSGMLQKSSPQSSLQNLNKKLEVPSLIIASSEDTGIQTMASSSSGEQSQKGLKIVTPTITVEDDIISPKPVMNQESTALKKAEHFIEIKPVQLAASVLSSETREAYHEEHKKEEKPKLNLFHLGSGKNELLTKNTSNSSDKHHVRSVGSSSEIEEKNKVSHWFSSKDTKDKSVQKPSLEVSPKVETSLDAPPKISTCSQIHSSASAEHPVSMPVTNTFTAVEENPHSILSPTNPFFSALQSNPFFEELLTDQVLKSPPTHFSHSLHCVHHKAENETENHAAATSASLRLDHRVLLDEVPKAISTSDATGTLFQRSLSDLKQESNHLDHSFDAFAASRLKSLPEHKPLASTPSAFMICKETPSTVLDLHRLKGYTETSSATIVDPEIGGRQMHVKSASCSSNVDKYSCQQPGLETSDEQVNKKSMPDEVLQKTVNKMQVLSSSDATLPLDDYRVPFTLLSTELSNEVSDPSQPELLILERCDEQTVTIADSTELNCNKLPVMENKTDWFGSILAGSQELAAEMSEFSLKIAPETDPMHKSISTDIVSDMKTSVVETAVNSNLSFLPSREAEENSTHPPRSNSLLPNIDDNVSSSKLPVLLSSEAKIEEAVPESSNTLPLKETCMISNDFNDDEHSEQQTVLQGSNSETVELPPPKPPRSFMSEHLFNEGLEKGLDKGSIESCAGGSPVKNRGREIGKGTEKNDSSLTVQVREPVSLNLDNKQITEEQMSDFILTNTSFSEHAAITEEDEFHINEVTADADPFKTCPSELSLGSSHLSSREDSSGKLVVVQPVLTSNLIQANPSEQVAGVDSCGITEVLLSESDLPTEVKEEKKVASHDHVFIEPSQSRKTGRLFVTAVSEHSVNPCSVPSQKTGTVFSTNSTEKCHSISVHTAGKDAVLTFSETNSGFTRKHKDERWPLVIPARVNEDKCSLYSELTENAIEPEESTRSHETSHVDLPLQNLSQQSPWLADVATNSRKDKLCKMPPDFSQNSSKSDHSSTGNPLVQPGSPPTQSNKNPFVESFSSHSNTSEYQPLDKSLQEDIFKVLHLKATPQNLQCTGLSGNQHVKPAFNGSQPLAFSTPCLMAATNSKLTILPSPTFSPTTFGPPSVTTQAETMFSFPAPHSSDIKASLPAVLPIETPSAEKLLLHPRTSPHPVKPLSSAIQDSSSDRKQNRSSLTDGTEKSKLVSPGTVQPVQPSQQGQIKHETKDTAVLDHAAKYYHLTHDELIQKLMLSEEELKNKQTRIHDLEDYIDTLLVRIIEQTPGILQVGSEPTANKMPRK